MARAIIFDYDGVLVESEPLHLAAFQQALPEFGLSLSDEEFWSRYVGLADEAIIRRLADAQNVSLDAADVWRVRERKNAAFEAMIAAGAPMLTGARDFVRAAAERMPVAVCSGARFVEIEATLRAAGLREIISAIVAVEDVARSKPDPEGYRKAVEQLRASAGAELHAGECIAIEDTEHGIHAARSAGLKVIAFRKPYADAAAAGAHRIVNGFAELDIDELARW